MPRGWAALLPEQSVQVYGDYALTKFYDPAQSWGLEEDWQELEELLARSGVNETVILGTAFGPDDQHLFDPGCCGSYFQTPDEVRAHSAKVGDLLARAPKLHSRLEPVVAMLRAAAVAKRGLYVTF